MIDNGERREGWSSKEGDLLQHSTKKTKASKNLVVNLYGKGLLKLGLF